MVSACRNLTWPCLLGRVLFLDSILAFDSCTLLYGGRGWGPFHDAIGENFEKIPTYEYMVMVH